MNTEENESFFDDSALFSAYLKDTEPNVFEVDRVVAGMNIYQAYTEDQHLDAPTSSEYLSNYNEESLHAIEPVPRPLEEPQVSTAPNMQVYVTAYYKPEKSEEFYLPRERDLILSLVYSPQSYWETKQVTFPSDPSESFYVKKKDPEHLGDIILNSSMNVHAISIEKIGAEVRTDALRKRKHRNTNDDDSVEETPAPKVKRRKVKNEEIKEEVEAVLSKCNRTYPLRVSIGDFKFNRTFEIRTARDLNKYRYLRKSVPLYKE